MDTIATRRLLLRPLAMSDVEDFYEYASHPDVGPNAGWQPLSSLSEARGKLQEFIDKDETRALVEKGSGKVIGSIALHPDKRRNHDKTRAIGYVLNPAYWGNGYMTEAAKAVIRHSFESAGLLILSIDHYVFNERSRRVIEKCGFVYEGTLRLAYEVYTGEIHDHVCYSITRDDYGKLIAAGRLVP